MFSFPVQEQITSRERKQMWPAGHGCQGKNDFAVQVKQVWFSFSSFFFFLFNGCSFPQSAKLKKLPPFMTMSLLRFSFDCNKFERYKETGRYSFPLTINLRPFCEQVQTPNAKPRPASPFTGLSKAMSNMKILFWVGRQLPADFCCPQQGLVPTL